MLVIMNIKRAILKEIYPLIMAAGKLVGSNKLVQKNALQEPPKVPIYGIEAYTSQGEMVTFERLKGKKILFVNTASDCGYTTQYAELEQLYKTHKDVLEILAFPANDFKEQEKGTDGEIERFCKLKYGLTFPLMKKSVVIKSPNQNLVYQWLTNEYLNGWCNQQPLWNFCKYLVDENGTLTHFFSQNMSPLDKVLIDAVES